MPKQTELPELPESCNHTIDGYVGIPVYTADQMREYALEENDRMRKELAAIKGEGEAVAWIESWEKDRIRSAGKRLLWERGSEPMNSYTPLVYLHPRAEPSDGEMLEWAIKDGWLSLPNADRTVWSMLTDEQEVSHFIDAIRAAMKEVKT